MFQKTSFDFRELGWLLLWNVAGLRGAVIFRVFWAESRVQCFVAIFAGAVPQWYFLVDPVCGEKRSDKKTLNLKP